MKKTLLWVSVALLAACGGQNTNRLSPDVYIAGTAFHNGVPSAKLWKNGEDQNLIDGSIPSSAHSVFVSGQDVYVAGDITLARDYKSSPFTRAKQWDDGHAVLWKNGVIQYIEDEASQARSVYVSGEDVYVGGSWEGNGRGHFGSVTAVWRNGIREDYGEGRANSIFVFDGDVYAAGDFPQWTGRDDHPRNGHRNAFLQKKWRTG